MNIKQEIGIAAVGDVLDINCWSSTPFYFYSSGLKAGLFSNPWRIDTKKLAPIRALWNLKQLLLLRGIGGFQYSSAFSNQVEKQISANQFPETIISFNQIFPRAKIIKNRGGKIYYYIDATLFDLFNEPDYGINIPDRIKKAALAQELENYQNAEAIVSMGKWVHHSLLNYYNLPKSRIHQILPGANVEVVKDFPMPVFVDGAGLTRDFILGFIGKDWERKGLPIIIEVAEILISKGYKIKIKAIGNCPDELKSKNCIEYTGFINKHENTKLFLDSISTCDIGCLFSSSEALGISTLEFLRVGIPVTGFFHQGLMDTLMADASLRISYADSSKNIAGIFEDYINNPILQRKMRTKAAIYSEYVTWERCIKEWEGLLNG